MNEILDQGSFYDLRHLLLTASPPRYSFWNCRQITSQRVVLTVTVTWTCQAHSLYWNQILSHRSWKSSFKLRLWLMGWNRTIWTQSNQDAEYNSMTKPYQLLKAKTKPLQTSRSIYPGHCTRINMHERVDMHTSR